MENAVGRERLPERVVLAGTRGAGPWVREHLLPPDWQVLPLADEHADPVADEDDAAGGTRGEASHAVVRPPLAVLALAENEFVAAAHRLAHVLPDGGDVLVVTAGSMRALAVVGEVNPTWQVCGLHMLFDIYRSGPEGQTCFVVPRDERDAALAERVAELVESAGGVVKRGSPERHDETMAYVQALPHRVLVSFVDAVLGSGLHLEDVLWQARTPLFEALLSLGVSALDTRRENSLVSAQHIPTAPRAFAEFDAALARFAVSADGDAAADAAADADADAAADADAEPEPAGLLGHLAEVRDALTGAAYDSLRRVGATAVQAIQGKRETLSRLRRSGELVGLRTVTDPGSLRVGRVVANGPSEVTIEELLVGPRGRAVLLDGPGVRNARRLGVAGRAHRTTFALGHVVLLEPERLEAELDDWLGVLHRDVRLLVPESVSGAGVLAAVEQLAQVRSAAHVDDVVRVGQRSVVLRLGFRSDRDVEASVESVRAHVAGVYRWPSGVVLTHRDLGPDGVARPIRYLGPAGSFSELAAGSVAELVPGGGEPQAVPTFDEVVAGAAEGELGVLPISSSASGLVSRAVAALLAGPREVGASGMVDVAVRFDAYGRAGAFLEELRGVEVYSHPQAIAQCGAFIRRWGLVPVPVASTARALEMLAEIERPAVALGVQDRGAALGLVTLEREVDDLPGSLTRFLVLGRQGSFGEPPSGSRPTLRRVWVGSGLRGGVLAATGSRARLDELLSDADGRFLLVTSGDGPLAQGFAAQARLLGEIPWSPRTPVVRPEPS